MAARRSIGENPLDLIVPQKPGTAGPDAKRGAETRSAEPSEGVSPGEAQPVRKQKPARKRAKKTAENGASKTKTRTKAEAPRKAASASAAGPRETETPESAERPRERPLAPPGQYLTFFLGGEEYGAAILQIKEIIEFDTLTAVPTTPPWIRGVLNLRGSVVPVIDLAVKFGQPETPVTQRTCVVILEVALESEKTVMGVMADAVSQVVDLGPEEIEPAPAFGTRITVNYLRGMGRLGEKFVLLLDVDRVLSTDELMAAAGARGATEAGNQDALGVGSSTVGE